MADNVTLNAGSGGASVRSKDRTGVETQIVALDLNPAGSETLMAGAMPVTGTFWQATQPVSLASNVTVVGTGTFVTQAAQSGSWTVTANAGTNLNTSLLALESGGNLAAINGKLPALGQALAAASVPVVLTASQLTTLTPPTTVGVTGTFWQSTQPVSLASSVTVVGTGTFAVQSAATQSGTWTVQPGNTANTTAWLVTGTGGTFPATQSGTWNVGVSAGTSLMGRVSSSLETGTIYNATTALTPKFAIITASSSGATTVVAAVTSKKIRVLRWRVSANGSVNVKWQSHVTPTDISGLSYGTQYKDCGGGFCPVGHFETVAGEALDINLSAAVAVSGELTYVEV